MDDSTYLASVAKAVQTLHPIKIGMSSPGDPIVVLDSGLGGLTVVQELRRTMPGEDLIYFGDTARVPYGSKTPATVTAFVRQIIWYLRPLRPKHVVVACNTATALAMPEVKSQFPELAITGVIEPGARAAVQAAGAMMHPLIAVIATEATVRSRAYERAIHRRRHRAHLYMQPAPLLVPIIEDGRREDDPLVDLALRQYLQPVIACNPTVLVLGCTHYPILKARISQIMGDRCQVIDSAEQCARDVAARLQKHGLNRGNMVFGEGHTGTLRCYVTDDSPKFQTLAARFLGTDVDKPIWVTPEELVGNHNDSVIRYAG